MAYSQSAYKASQKYKAAHIKRIPFEVQIEYHELIKKAAAQAGVSVNTYIKEAIEMRIQAESQKEESPE